MDTNPVIDMVERHLRLAVIGGGPGSFIGAMHRTAARLDDRFEVVAGVLSSNPERSRAAATAIGIPADCAYRNAEPSLRGERAATRLRCSVGATAARDYGALGKGRDAARVPAAPPSYGAGVIERPRPTLISRGDWGVRRVAGEGFWLRGGRVLSRCP